MNTQKAIAILVAVAINCAVLAWFHAFTPATVATVVPVSHAEKVLTLPTITVRPTPAQIEMLKRERTPAATSGAAPIDHGVQALVMPYYSFADGFGEAGNG